MPEDSPRERTEGQEGPRPPADQAGAEMEDPPAGAAAEPHDERTGPGSREDQAAEAKSAATVEAVLFASEKPLTPVKVSEIGHLGGVRAVRRAVAALNRRYEQAGASFRIVHIAGGYQMQTLPEYGDVLARLVKSREESRLTQAALETLAVIAYRQPTLRADVEAIRGVACGEVIRGLMEKNLLRIVGRAEEIGRPLLYGTTRHFLEVFGLADLDDLPNAEQLRIPAKPAKPAPTQGAEPGRQEPSPAQGGEGQTQPAGSASADPPAADATEKPPSEQAPPADRVE